MRGCRRGVQGGSSMGKRVQGMVKGWGQGDPAPLTQVLHGGVQTDHAG